MSVGLGLFHASKDAERATTDTRPVRLPQLRLPVRRVPSSTLGEPPKSEGTATAVAARHRHGYRNYGCRCEPCTCADRNWQTTP
jgi:hypothetical protein